MVPIKLNKIFFSGLLRPQSSNPLLKNFRDFLSLEKKLETLQQELYHCILAKPLPYSFHTTLVRNSFLPFVKTKTRVDPALLLPCNLASGVPVKDIQTIKAEMHGVTESDWESFDILTREGAVIREIWTVGAAYSPVIQEIMKQGKLLKLR